MKSLKFVFCGFFIFTAFFYTVAQVLPWEKYGFDPKVVTLSKGKYQEFHDLKTVVEIGSIFYNVETKQIIGFVEDSLNSDALKPHIISRWISIDPLSEEYSSWSPYNYAMNNPVVNIDPDGRIVVTVNSAAQQAILNTLTKEDMAYVKFDKNGMIDRNLLNSSESSSGNFSSLKQLVNDDRTFEFNVTDKITYKDEKGNLIEKSLGPITQSNDKNGSFGLNTGEEGWQGVTQTPGDGEKKYNSPDNSIKIVINSGLSEDGQAQITAHEAYGHAFLYSKGVEHRHQAKSTTEGFKETNKALAEQIVRAISETIKNMEEKRNGN